MTKIEKSMVAAVLVMIGVMVFSFLRAKQAIDDANPKKMIEEVDTKKVGEWFGEKTKGFREGFEEASQ